MRTAISSRPSMSLGSERCSWWRSLPSFLSGRDLRRFGPHLSASWSSARSRFRSIFRSQPLWLVCFQALCLSAGFLYGYREMSAELSLAWSCDGTPRMIADQFVLMDAAVARFLFDPHLRGFVGRIKFEVVKEQMEHSQ